MGEFNIEVGKKIKDRRRALNMTLKELGELVDLSEGTMQRYEVGKIKGLDLVVMTKIANALKLSPAYLMGWEEYNLPVHTVKIPILGSVPAGTPIEAITNIVGEVEIDERLTLSGNYFALKIKGESMMPDIKDGDVVIVREQDAVETGEIAIVYVNGYEATCKKVIINKTNLILQPLNPTYEAQAFDWSEVHELPVAIVGKVVEARRFF